MCMCVCKVCTRGCSARLSHSYQAHPPPRTHTPLTVSAAFFGLPLGLPPPCRRSGPRPRPRPHATHLPHSRVQRHPRTAARARARRAVGTTTTTTTTLAAAATESASAAVTATLTDVHRARLPAELPAPKLGVRGGGIGAAAPARGAIRRAGVVPPARAPHAAGCRAVGGQRCVRYEVE